MPTNRSRQPGAVRIIGGRWKRSLLPIVPADGLRPTPDRVRKTVFDWLTHYFGGSLEGRSVLDLFAGTGALGFEAASRGAAPIAFRDSHPAVIERIRRNAERFGASAVDARRSDALEAIASCQSLGMRFDVVFLDPPFGSDLLARTLRRVPPILKPGGLIYAEGPRQLGTEDFGPLGLAAYRSDRAGEVFYHLLHCNNNG